ncbi:hypothetical protein V2A60_009780 [Cordyceps javanica]
MRTSTVASALACATCIGAFVTIPDNLADGVYQVEQRPGSRDGPIIKRMTDDTPPAGLAGRGSFLPPGPPAPCPGPGCERRRRAEDRIPVQLADTLPLPASRAFCRNETRTMTLEDLHGAANRLFYTPLFWIPPRSARFALHNGAVAYVCNLGDWATGSLVEYMEAMRILDERCDIQHDDDGGGGGTVRAAKLAVAEWEQFLGREAAGFPICQWETQPGGIENELMTKQAEGCKTYIGVGIRRLLGGSKGEGEGEGETECNENVTGPGLWERLAAMFPWYNRLETATSG